MKVTGIFFSFSFIFIFFNVGVYPFSAAVN